MLNISLDRAKKSVNILKSKKQPVNMADFFLNETMAQLQLAMFGVSEEFEKRTNKKMRNGLAGLEKRGTIRDLAFDLIDESKKYAALLGYNYGSSQWYKRSYKILNKNYKEPIMKKANKEDGLIKRTIKKLLLKDD